MAAVRHDDGTWWTETGGPLIISHCCRDWPIALWARLGRCGDCGERPKATTKTVDEYMAERATSGSATSSQVDPLTPKTHHHIRAASR